MWKLEHLNSSRYLKYLLLLSIAIAAAFRMLYPFSSGYYSLLEITYGKNDFPSLVINLEDRDYPLTLDIGSRFPLSLSRETLDRIIDKQAQGTITLHNLSGQKNEVPSYLIPKLQVGNLTLKNVTVHETQGKNHNLLGKFLGGEFNLLMDFPHSRIIACDTFSKLQSKQLVGKDWICIPLEIHPGGIIINVDTDFGTRKLAINTTSSVSFLSSSFIPSNHSFASSIIILGERKFGNLTFDSIDLPNGLSEIDGFIGMDFLKEHGIYFDYSNKIAYIEPPKKYFESIPVTLGPRNQPIIDVSIEGSTHPFKLDLGSSISFSLSERILQKIDKTKYGNFKWFDFKGTAYETSLYTIPEIKIGNLTFPYVFANQDDEDFHTNVTFDGPPLQFPGVIGLPILEKYNLLLDFSNSKIYASNDHFSLQNLGLLSQHLLAIPFSTHPDGIILNVETDSGIYRLVLDTGCTFTMMKPPHPIFTEKFCIMGHDFGEHSIKVLDVSQKFDWDGTIGMDFIKEHPIFIDNVNKMVFIDLLPYTNAQP